jgi:hypothetical protein
MPRVLADGRFITPVGISRVATPSCERSMSSKTPMSRLPGWLTAGLHYASVLLRCRDDSWPPLIGVSRIANSKCLNIMSPEFPISRWGQTPMVFDDCHLSHRWTAVIVPGFSLRISRLFPDDGHLSSTLTLVVPPCLRHRRDIADRDSQRRSFLIFENPDFPIHDSTGSSDTRHAQWTVQI